MKEKFYTILQQAQELSLRLFTENEFAEHNEADAYYLHSRCGSYFRLHQP